MLKSFIDQFRKGPATEFLQTFPDMMMGGDTEPFALQALYGLTPEKTEAQLRGAATTSLFDPAVSNSEDGQVKIVLTPPSDDRLEALQAVHPDVKYLELACFQKFYKDHRCNFARNLLLKGPYGQPVLRFNNLGALGQDVVAGQRVNLFVGASETFECSLTPLQESHALPDWIAQSEVPFNEMGINLNAGVEGAHFPLIVQKAKQMRREIVEADAIIENLFVFGGWHNLIYNENTPEAWQGCLDDMSGVAQRTCLFEIASPLLVLTFEEIEAFCSRGHPFWGYLDCSRENYDKLKDKILEYNSWLEGVCTGSDTLLYLPTNSFLTYDAATVDTFFRDVNHFARSEALRHALIAGLNGFLMRNADFFTPQMGSVSEYIYPTF